MIRLPVRPLLATLPFLLVACASSRADPFDEGGGSIRIEVDNQNFQDATLYALSSTGRRRLGRVTGKSQGEFTMDWNFSDPLRIHIDLLAAGSCTTRGLLVSPGEIVQLIVSSRLDSDPDCR